MIGLQKCHCIYVMGDVFRVIGMSCPEIVVVSTYSIK
jgi:hypothetical protein